MNNNRLLLHQASMEGRERVMMREKRLYEASLSGSVESLNELTIEDGLILARVSVTCFNETPLHVAAMLGHVDFARALLDHKRDLVTELDLQGRAPLHLASANGYVEMVKMLLLVDSNVCCFRDEDRRTPLHLAAMKGRVDIVQELVQGRPEVTRYNLDRGVTILHLCVIHNRLEALKLLVKLCNDDDFVNFQDDDGNTILHTATVLKQMETIEYLLSRTGVRVNLVNKNGFTALDIIQHTPRDLKVMEIREVLVGAGVLRARNIPASASDTRGVNTTREGDQNNEVVPPSDTVTRTVAVARQPTRSQSTLKQYLNKQDKWLKKKRDAVLVAASVIAAMAYQAGLNPPSGVWQEDVLDPKNNQTKLYVAGTSIMAANYPSGYPEFFIYNTVSFIASLSIILLIVCGLPLKRRILMWLLLGAMYLTMTFMTLTYLVSLQAVSPDHESEAITKLVTTTVYSWLGLVGVVFLGHTCSFIIWVVRKVRKCIRRRMSSNVNEGGGQNQGNV